MDSGTFKLLLLLILVIGFTAGTAYGIFNFDFGTISDTDTVAVVDDILQLYDALNINYF